MAKAKKAPKHRIIATRSAQVEALVTNGAVDTSLVGKAYEVENAKLAFDGHTAYYAEVTAKRNALYAERDALNLRISEAEAEVSLASASLQHAHSILSVRTNSMTSNAWNNVHKGSAAMQSNGVLGGNAAQPAPYPY